MNIYNKFVKITGTLSDRICIGCESLEVEFALGYTAYCSPVEDTLIDIESIEIVGFLDNETGFSVELDKETKEEVLALIDNKDYALLEELEDSYYYGLNY